MRLCAFNGERLKNELNSLDMGHCLALELHSFYVGSFVRKSKHKGVLSRRVLYCVYISRRSDIFNLRLFGGIFQSS